MRLRYFEVVGPHGGPVISEGVQILQYYSEVIGPDLCGVHKPCPLLWEEIVPAERSQLAISLMH